MSKHTETPWEVGQANIVFVGTGVGDPIKQSVVAQIYGDRDQAVADAAFIVRAVNAYEGLVRALAACIADMEETENFYGTHEYAQTVLANARAALSAAKE